jgi:hypothetical protein
MRQGREGAFARVSAQLFPKATKETLRASRARSLGVLCASLASLALKIAATKLITIHNKHWENQNA